MCRDANYQSFHAINAHWLVPDKAGKLQLSPASASRRSGAEQAQSAAGFGYPAQYDNVKSLRHSDQVA